MNESSDHLTRLLKLIENHRWTRAHIEWEALARVYRAYLRNAAELLLVITEPQREPNLALSIMSDDQTNRVRDNYYDELFRHLMNYVTAVRTLIEHSRNHMQQYSSSYFDFEYNNRKAQLVHLKVGDFLNRLRNYLLHARFPPLQVYFHWSQEPPVSDFAVTLNRETLLEWDGWTKGSKAYIRRKDPLVIRETVEEYASAIEGFYQWLFQQFAVVHEQDYKEVIELKRQARQMAGFGDE